jgi:hypothetical protein
MQIYTKITYIIFLLLLIINFSDAQNFTNFFFNGNGARAVGMGNAYTAIADDATAIAWNSAGLINKKYAQAAAIGRFGKSSTDISGFKDFGIDSWDINTDIYSQINYVGFTYPLNIRKIKTTVGIAYRRIHDFSRNEVNTLKGTLFGDPTGTVEVNKQSGGGVGAFAISGGFRLHKMFSVGTTLNLYTGSETNHTTYKLDGIIDYDRSTGDKTNYSGFGVDIGLLFKPLKNLSIGANINLPHSLDSEGDSVNIDLNIPTFYTLGIAFRATKNLLFAFDYRPQPLDKIKIDDRYSDADDIYSLHFGLEYKIRGKKKKFPIRFGYYMNSESNNALNADKVYTGGISFPFQNFSIDLGFEYATTKYTVEDEFDSTSYNANHESNDYRMTIGFAFDLVRR